MRCSEIHYCAIVAFALAFVRGPVHAAEAVSLANTRAAEAYARTHRAPAWLKGKWQDRPDDRKDPLRRPREDESLRELQAIGDRAAKIAADPRVVLGIDDGGEPSPAPPSRGHSPSAYAPGSKTILLLVSAALGHSQLRELYQIASGRDEVRIVYRGVARGATLDDFMRGVYRDLTGIDPAPDVVIDPTRFPAGVEPVAPEILMLDGTRVIARARGTTDIDRFRERVSAARGALSPAEAAETVTDLGQLGPTVAVSEPDLIAELKRRLAGLDLKSIRDRAAGRFWTRAHLVTLPESEHDRLRTIDLTVEARTDITAPDGRVLVRAGATIDPLDRIAFGQRLVVFDATRPAQIEAARRVARAPGATRVTYLATDLDRERGWEGFREIEAALDAPVYLLTPDVRRRFRIERAPSVVEVRDGAMAVREIGMRGHEPSGNSDANF